MAEGESGADGGEPALADPKDKLILIVDDDEGQRDLMAYLVNKEGFKLDKVGAARQGLNYAREKHPDLILLDLMLPEMGGYELVRELQAEGLGDIPVVIVSARDMDEQTVSALRAEPNVKDFFHKPPQKAQLALLLHSLLKTRAPVHPRTQPGW